MRPITKQNTASFSRRPISRYKYPFALSFKSTIRVAERARETQRERVRRRNSSSSSPTPRKKTLTVHSRRPASVSETRRPEAVRRKAQTGPSFLVSSPAPSSTSNLSLIRTDSITFTCRDSFKVPTIPNFLFVSL